jgi:hypothetical protein
MNKIETWLRVAGTLHFCILLASAMTPRALDWRNSLASLHPFLRRLFWVYGAFIVLVIVAFGTITLLFTPLLAGGAPLSRAVCIFICIFWSARLCVQLFVFDARPFLVNWFYKTGYNGLTAVFAYLAAVYALAAIL